MKHYLKVRRVGLLVMVTLILVTVATIIIGEKAESEECDIKDGKCTVITEKLEKETIKEKTPKKFKNSAINRKMKDGSLQSFDGNKFKIVPRISTRYKKKQIPIVISVPNKEVRKPHTVKLMAGHAPDQNVTLNTSPNKATLSHAHRIHLGLSYDYDILSISENVDLNIGGLGITNKTIMGTVGVSF